MDIMRELIVVGYIDGDNKSRWGYVRHSDWRLFQAYLKNGRPVEAQEDKVLVYLPDGKTGECYYTHLHEMERFARRGEPNEATGNRKNEPKTKDPKNKSKQKKDTVSEV